MAVLYIILIGYLLGNIIFVQAGEYKFEEQQAALLKAEYSCYEQMDADPVILTGVFCPRQFDNILCWKDSVVGITHKQHCPSYINRFDTSEFAYKTCLENGTWYFNPKTNTTWTNFSKCVIEPEPVSQLIKNHMPKVRLLYLVGYSASLSTLLLAVSIMLYFRRLRCPRNLIHVNLFIVYILRALISLLKDILLVENIGFPADLVQGPDGGYEFKNGSHWGCKMFFTILNYLILTSILWIFVEGLYLQLLLSYSVHIKKLKIRWFVLLGWGIPVIFAVAWGVARFFYDDSYCWNVSHYNKHLYWIIRGPIVISVIVTFLIFLNILRLLFTKLTAQNCPSSRRYRYRRLVKSTLILIPLFAVYYMGFIWLPDDLDAMSQLVELYIEMLFNSFQGFLVALLFCFMNTEVQTEIKKKWNRYVLRREGSLLPRRAKPRRQSETKSSAIYKPKSKLADVKNSNTLKEISEETVPLRTVDKLCEHNGHDQNDNIHLSENNDIDIDIHIDQNAMLTNKNGYH